MESFAAGIERTPNGREQRRRNSALKRATRAKADVRSVALVRHESDGEFAAPVDGRQRPQHPSRVCRIQSAEVGGGVLMKTRKRLEEQRRRQKLFFHGSSVRATRGDGRWLGARWRGLAAFGLRTNVRRRVRARHSGIGPPLGPREWRALRWPQHTAALPRDPIACPLTSGCATCGHC
jgi:hypothetical protein